MDAYLAQYLDRSWFLQAGRTLSNISLNSGSTVNHNSLNIDYRFVTDAGFLEDALSIFKDSKEIAVKVETTGVDPFLHKIRLIQITSKDKPVVIVDLFQLKDQDLTPLRELLESDIEKVFHDVKFNLKFLINNESSSWSLQFSGLV